MICLPGGSYKDLKEKNGKVWCDRKDRERIRRSNLGNSMRQSFFATGSCLHIHGHGSHGNQRVNIHWVFVSFQCVHVRIFLLLPGFLESLFKRNSTSFSTLDLYILIMDTQILLKSASPRDFSKT